MENIPKKIYLQIGEDLEPDEFTGDFSELSGVSWCTDKINDNDLVYIRIQKDMRYNSLREFKHGKKY